MTRTPEYGRESHILLSSILDEGDQKAGVFAQLLANAQRDPEETHDLYLPGDTEDEENENAKEDNNDETSEQTTPTGTSTAESKTDGQEGDEQEGIALEPAGTKEDDEEYFKQKRKEGKNEDGPEKGEEKGTHFNDKPSKRPTFIQDGQKLDLKVGVNHHFFRLTEILKPLVAKSPLPQVCSDAADWTCNFG